MLIQCGRGLDEDGLPTAKETWNFPEGPPRISLWCDDCSTHYVWFGGEAGAPIGVPEDHRIRSTYMVLDGVPKEDYVEAVLYLSCGRK